MKKTITILLFLISIMTYSQGKIGIVAGINATTFSDGILESFGIHSNSFSFHFGGVYELELSDKISFRPKILYSQQGDRENFDESLRYKTSSLNFPLNFKFYNKPYITIGPQIGFLMDTNKRFQDYGDLKSFDYGMNLGVGYDINDLFVELNVYQGFNELIEVGFEHTSIKATNTIVQLSIGYYFY